MFRPLLSLLLVAAATQGSVLKSDEKLKFSVIASRSIEEPPTIDVTFANGMQDALDLSHFRMHEQATVGCNYHGTLKNDPSAVVAVTGCLNKPGDKMEVTLISKNNINKMFEVDFDGNAEIIKNPFAEGAQSGALKTRDDGWHEEGGDEEKNDEEENAAHNVRTTSIPSKLKATIQFGYEDGMKEALGGEDFDAWVQTVMVHTQTHYRHAESLGTTIEFEVVGTPSVHLSGVNWFADNNIYDARDASNANSGTHNPDVFAWWSASGGGGVAGIAFVGVLCTSYHTSLNEKQHSAAGSGFVLAHELGHNFGMSHDFDESHGGHDGPCNGQGIMSYGSYDYDQWSTCSRSDWEQHYASRNWGDGCLEDISDEDSNNPATAAPTEAPGTEVCFDVTTNANIWAHEIQWNIGGSTHDSCENEKSYENHEVHTQQCCLSADHTEFAITCKDTYGDGWHGGYLEINGEQYCANFTNGDEFSDVLPNPNPEAPDVCTPIKLVTKRWGNEISWTFGDCSSSQEYGNHNIYTEECCQKAGSYPITCKDSYGDGWHGGYLEIEGTKYCKEFRDGGEQTEEGTMEGDGSSPTEAPTGAPPTTECGINPGAIVGGSEVTPYSLPWQVGLVSPGSKRTWCGGTLIGPQHVLTAAHCMGGNFEVVVGEHSIQSSDDGTRHTVCSTTSHPQYNTGTSTNYDFAIVRLSQPVELGARAVPACLPTADMGGSYLDDKTMTVSGWGATSQGGSQAQVLMSVDVPGVTNAKCQQAYGESSITDAMLCAGRDEGGIDSCQGDSGGPLTFTSGTPAREYIVGVVSWGYGCAVAGYPGVYARVTHVSDWINAELAKGC